MKLKLLMYFIILNLIVGCTRTLEFDNIINQSESIALSKGFINAKKHYQINKIFSVNSNEWKLFYKWLQANNKGWESTVASYNSEIKINQGDFNFLFLSFEDKESVVINFIDIDGEINQYQKEISKGELDFIIGEYKKILRIKEYGFNSEKHNRKVIKRLNLNEYKTYGKLKKDIDRIICNDSIPQIEFINKKEIIFITPFDYCYSNTICNQLIMKDIIEVRSNQIIEGGEVYDLDSLYTLMKRNYLNTNINDFEPQPDKLSFQLIYEDDENISKLKDFLDILIVNFDSLKIKQSLKIRFSRYEYIETTDKIIAEE